MQKLTKNANKKYKITNKFSIKGCAQKTEN